APQFCCQAEDGIRDRNVTGVQTCALPIFAFLVSLAFAIAASANLPSILYSLYWKRFNTRGSLWSIYGGPLSAIFLITFSPVVSEIGRASGRGAEGGCWGAECTERQSTTIA